MKKTTFSLIALLVVSSMCFANTATKTPAPIKGLVNMGDITFYNKQNNAGGFPQPNNSLNNLILPNTANLFGGTVINLRWADLEPAAPDDNGNITLNTATLDSALMAIHTYNQTATVPITAKIRIFGGFAAPHWAKWLDGAPLYIDISKGAGISQVGTVGHWWSPQYLEAWTGFLTALATKTEPNFSYTYNNDPLISEISITSCASSTDEPFISWTDSETLNILLEAGYSDAAQKICLMTAVHHYAAWNNTMLDFPISPFFPLQALFPIEQSNSSSSDTLNSGPNIQFSKIVMEICSELTNGRCIISNQGLNQYTSMNSNLQQIYDAIQEIVTMTDSAPYADFQTVSPEVLSKSTNDSWCALINAGVSFNAQSIELWPSVANLKGFDTLPVGDLQSMSAAVLNHTQTATCAAIP